MESVNIRRAVAADLHSIVRMLADDPLGAGRESPWLPLDSAYVNASDAISADPNRLLAVATIAGDVVGTLQLSFIPVLHVEELGEGKSRQCGSIVRTVP